MKTHYGQISLTKLGEIKKKHPELIKEVTFKDGHTELFINIEIHDKKEPDKFGNTAFVKASVSREAEKEGVNYFVGDLKKSAYNEQPTQNFPAPSPIDYDEELGF